MPDLGQALVINSTQPSAPQESPEDKSHPPPTPPAFCCGGLDEQGRKGVQLLVCEVIERMLSVDLRSDPCPIIF